MNEEDRLIQPVTEKFIHSKIISNTYYDAASDKHFITISLCLYDAEPSDTPPSVHLSKERSWYTTLPACHTHHDLHRALDQLILYVIKDVNT